MKKREFKYYGRGIPYFKEKTYAGRLIVIEGADCSGRSMQMYLLRNWLEAEGHAVADMGLSRSNLIGDAIQKAKEGNTLGKKTLSLLYATDFADQLENKILPVLKAGFIVLADRYIFTLMARDMVRGASREWLEKMYGFAPVPDLIFYLKVDTQILLYRALEKYGTLDYWESGMDLSLSNDIFESFKIYQKLIAEHFDQMALDFGFITLDGDENPVAIQEKIRSYIKRYLLDESEIESSAGE